MKISGKTQIALDFSLPFQIILNGIISAKNDVK